MVGLVGSVGVVAAQPTAYTHGLKLRNVGPTVMSGRVVDVALGPGDGSEFYVAYATGGVWHTENHGTSFEPVSDGIGTTRIGAIAVHPKTERLWVGTGEANASRSSYSGTGMHVSDDGGKVWREAGLKDVRHIARIVVHPDDPATAWVAAMGALYTTNTTGGVYVTRDGGVSWKRVLKVPGSFGDAGAIDLVLDPRDANHLWAATWDRTRRAWNFEEAGVGSGVWESRDGGVTWQAVNEGLPAGGQRGRIGLALHGATGTLYALVDNQGRGEDEEDEDEGMLKKEDFLAMDREAFARLDRGDLARFLEDNGFPEADSAATVFERVAAGGLKPRDLHDWLVDGNRALFDTPVIGAEVLVLRDGRWTRTHAEPLRDVCYTYGYYFGMIEVDPSTPDRLYIAGVPLLVSEDGGATWKKAYGDNVHVDHHALVIHPDRPGHLISGNDGGVNVSWDYGKHWTSANSPAVGQFYTVEVDEASPYRIYGGLQDNGSWVGPSEYTYSPDWLAEGRYPWERLGGGDGMQVEVDPRSNEVVIFGSQFGYSERLDRRSGERWDLHPLHALGEAPLRWNWQTPVLLSRHQPDVLYMASHAVHRSLDQGKTWEKLSGDLTHGGRVGDVPYGTITSLHESPMRFGMLAAGTDDGRLHVSRDGGYTWTELPFPLKSASPDARWWVAEVLWSHHVKDRLYVALNGHRLDDATPQVFVTETDGRTWTRVQGLPAGAVNALAESADRPELLVVGSDSGCFLSLDRGATWTAAHPDLPPVPVHDLVVQERENELVIGTHGRSIYVLDLAPLLDHWAGEAPAGRAFAVLEEPEATWSKRWGKPGWAWAEPKAPVASGVLFAPVAGELWLEFDELVIDAGEVVAGWQPFDVPLATGGDPAYLAAGDYPFTLRLEREGKPTVFATSTLHVNAPED